MKLCIFQNYRAVAYVNGGLLHVRLVYRGANSIYRGNTTVYGSQQTVEVSIINTMFNLVCIKYDQPVKHSKLGYFHKQVLFNVIKKVPGCCPFITVT